MFSKDISRFHEIDHTADMGLEITGDTTEALFANALHGMYHLLLGNLKISDKNKKLLHIQERTLPELFVTWLSEINFLLMVDNFFVGRIVSLSIYTDNKKQILHALLRGDDDLQYKRHMQTEIKAVTYHGLSVIETKYGYRARVIFDI